MGWHFWQSLAIIIRYIPRYDEASNQQKRGRLYELWTWKCWILEIDLQEPCSHLWQICAHFKSPSTYFGWPLNSYHSLTSSQGGLISWLSRCFNEAWIGVQSGIANLFSILPNQQCTIHEGHLTSPDLQWWLWDDLEQLLRQTVCHTDVAFLWWAKPQEVVSTSPWTSLL